MNYPKYFFLLPKEEATMKVLWSSDKAMSAAEIAENIPNRTWPASSIQNILRNLEKKNAIKVDSITKIGKSYGRLFKPTISVNEYAVMQFNRYYQGNKKECFSIINSLLGNSGNNKEDLEDLIEALQSLLDEYKKED